MEAGIGNFTGKAKDCPRDGHPDLEGWARTENRQRDYKNVVWEEMTTHFIQQSRYFVQIPRKHD